MGKLMHTIHVSYLQHDAVDFFELNFLVFSYELLHFFNTRQMKDVLKVLKKRLGNKNPKIQLLALFVSISVYSFSLRNCSSPWFTLAVWISYILRIHWKIIFMNELILIKVSMSKLMNLKSIYFNCQLLFFLVILVSTNKYLQL